MGKRTFRPPQAVLKTVTQAGGTSAEFLEGQPLSLGEVQQMYNHLSGYLEKTGVPQDGGWLSYGGDAGLRWARRILRQEGILKTADVGETLLPEIIDLQLGPQVIAAVAKQGCDQVVSVLKDNSVPCSCVPMDGRTLVFMSKEGEVPVGTDPVSFPVGQIDLGDLSLLDESGSRLRSIVKHTGTNQVRATCFPVLDPVAIVDGLVFEKAYLLTTTDEVVFDAQVIKVDTQLGLVLGWAVICKKNGEAYFDSQGDHIPEESMLEAAADFMQHYRIGKDLHRISPAGTIVFAWPLTDEVAKAFDIETDQTGLMIAMKPNAELLEKFRSGEYKGFSIGGKRVPEHTEEVE